MQHLRFAAFGFLAFMFCGVYAQDNCVVLNTGSPMQPLPRLVNTAMPVVMIYVDFADSRKPDGSLPTVDADTAFFRGDSINAVAGMGWVKDSTVFPVQLRKKIRKYVYEDYWNMLFSDSSYYDDSVNNIHPHPDWSSHHNLLSHGMRVYGSMRDYYRELSYGNLFALVEVVR
jgi:hypothetical protein